MQERRVPSLGREDPLEKRFRTHSSILAWKIPRIGAWRATVRGVAEPNRNDPLNISNMHTHSHTVALQCCIWCLLGNQSCHDGPSLVTSSKPYCLPKAPSQITTRTSGITFSTCELPRDIVQCISGSQSSRQEKMLH